MKNIEQIIRANASQLQAEQWDQNGLIKELTANPPPSTEVEKWLRENNKNPSRFPSSDIYRQKEK